MNLVRINKYISQTGFCSRRKAEEYILNGDVFVNGICVKDLSTQIDLDKDKVKIGGKILKLEEKLYYILFYKPKYVVTTLSDPQKRETVSKFFKKFSVRLYPVGRLDYESEGALLMTNDGDFANKLMHPSFEKVKTYSVTVDKKLSEVELKNFSDGVLVDDKLTSKSFIKFDKKISNKFQYIVKIHEGRNRQIRKMFAFFNSNVVELKRIAIASIELGTLKAGEYRYLTKEEINSLLSEN
ncbi:rRNA pseudouridine synthase [bacterium]|nr:rRNA pseudouridine synthase [bacterium]